MANIGDYMSGQKGLLDKPIEDLMARAFNTDTMKSVLKNDTARSVLQFLVGDGSDPNKISKDDRKKLINAGVPASALDKPILQGGDRKLMLGKIAAYAKGTGRIVSAKQAVRALLGNNKKNIKKRGGISKAVSEAEKKYAAEKTAKRSAAAKMGAKKRAERIRAERGVRGGERVAPERAGISKGLSRDQLKYQAGKQGPGGINTGRLPSSERGLVHVPQRNLGFRTQGNQAQQTLRQGGIPPKPKQIGTGSSGGGLQNVPPRGEVQSLRSIPPKDIRGRQALAIGAGAAGATGIGLLANSAMQPPSLPSQGQIDQAQGIVNSDEYKRTQQTASTPNAPSQSQIDKAQGVVNSPQYGQTQDIASGTTPATDTTPATTTKADSDNKGGVVNWMKRLAPLIAGIGGTGIAAAIGGKDAALGYAQGFSGEYMKGQERNRQQAELERKEKRLDLKEATARMDDLLIAGAIAPAQAIFESMADQWSEKEKTMWGDAFKEAQRSKDEGKTDAMFIKRMEAFQISGVLAQNGQIGPAVEAYNKYLPEDKHITSDDMEEFRRGRMWEDVYQDQVANNMSPNEAATIANTAVDKLLNGYVTYKQARLNAKLKNNVIEASNNKDEKTLNKISLNTDVPADIREEADKALAKINEDRQVQGQSGVNMTEEMFKPIGFGLRGLPQLPGGLLNIFSESGSGAYKGVTGQ